MRRGSRKIEYIIFSLLLFIGFIINFIPTINYYLIVYPNLNDNIFSDLAFIEYNLYSRFALVEIPDRMENNITIVLILNQGTLRLSYVNETVLGYNITADIELSFPLNGTNINRELRSEGFIPWSSILGQLLVLSPNSNEVTVNISDKIIELEKVPPNVISFDLLLNPKFYLKPVAYHGKMVPEVNGTEAYAVYLTYWEMENGDLLLTSHAYTKRYQPIDDIAVQLLRIIFSGDPDLVGLIEGNSDKISGLRLVVGVNDANVKVKNDLLGRILFDFTVTYFPVNIALMVVGFIGLILVHRGRI